MKNYEFLVNRILSNKLTLNIGGDKFIYRSPSAYTKYYASLLYEQAIDSYKYEEWITTEQAKIILVRNSLVSYTYEESLKSLEKEIEEAKITLFQNSFNDKLKKDIRKHLGLLKNKQNEIHYKAHLLDQYTLEGYANLVKYNYIFENSIIHNKKRLVKHKLPFYILESLVNKLNSNAIEYSDLRAMVRKEPWSSLWRASGGKPFRNSPSEWTDEQKNIVLVSKMYDNVYKNPDCPPDDIIDEDDMLDGWMILQRREADVRRNADYVKKSIKGLDKAKGNEHFIPAQSPEHAAKIHELNDIGAKAVKAQRQQILLKTEDEVKDGQFLDKRLELSNLAKEKFVQRGK